MSPLAWLEPLCPEARGRFLLEQGRLAQFKPAAAMEGYWRRKWADPARRRWLQEQARGPALAPYHGLLARHAPRELPVLEAGCGVGQVAAALQAAGHRTVGVEADGEAVAFGREVFPGVDLRAGDVRDLGELASGSIGCYLSLGVLEHFPGIPWGALAEARRVLDPRRGVALISVPHLNAPRRYLQERLFRRPPGEGARAGLAFYQYYFAEAELRPVFERAGLQVLEAAPLFCEAALLREHPLVARWWRSPFCRDRMKRALRGRGEDAPAWFRRRYAHMMMYACRPS